LAAWIDREKFTAALEALVDEMSDQGSIPTPDQAKRLSALESELEALGHLEEATISASYSRGVDLARRPSALPSCVLSVRVVAAKVAAAAE
jgi:hypothetical protein